MSDHANQEGTQYDSDENEMEELERLPPLEESPFENPPPTVPVESLELPEWGEFDDPADLFLPPRTPPRRATPKRPRSQEGTSDDSQEVTPELCKICKHPDCERSETLGQAKEKRQKMMRIKKKIEIANKLNAKLEVLIQDLDQEGPMNKDMIRAVLRTEPDEVLIDDDDE